MTIKENNNTKNSVIIIGAGLASLALANVLKYQGVPYKIFEREKSPDDRTQGWSLSMHFCLVSLKASMDPVKYATLGEKSAVDPEFPQKADFCMVNGNTGERVASVGGYPGVDVFRVNRKRFRAWLMEGIDVTWNKRLEHYKVTEEGVEATFTDGTVEYGRLIVGADGVNSQVCRQLIGAEEFNKTTTPNPLRVLACSYWVNSELRRQIEESLAPAHMMSIASSTEDAEHSICLFSSLIDVDKSRENPYEMVWSISNLDENEPHYETDQERLKQAKEWLNNAGFTGPLHQLVMETPEGTNMVALQLRERSPHSKLDTLQRDLPVVLVGDALHTMTMYRGEGGNHAIEDSSLLGMELAKFYKGEKSLEEAVDIYYKEALPRGRKAVADSHEAAKTVHSSRAKVLAMINATKAAIEKRYIEKLNQEENNNNNTSSADSSNA
ncbi:hypothetical protein BDA99DRAFT_443860 [Phascolomyces articulosus]|uniref:FAD-binding domain-containing protein n=1 Tax=Phascolomyces articulosus TaxID=60185 RepID=A0AAD5PAK2_9FUNG|nr:hypothetical protein BDA99DRAFT_443860 [Phascolomyces articulosus]